MAVTVSGTSITFNDATVQSTAAGAPTTATVLSATKDYTSNVVGTFTVGCISDAVVLNQTQAGQYIFGPAGNYLGYSGTWRALGAAPAGGYPLLWVRIS